MDHDFDGFIKQHLQEALCVAEKSHALSLLTVPRPSLRQRAQLKLAGWLIASGTWLRDGAGSPGFSHSRS